MLQLRDLAVAVPGTGNDLRISERVRPGELVVAPAEPAAATALARTVAGLVAPVSGRVLVGDRDVTDAPPAERQIGYLPAGGGLLPHLTVRANVEYGLRRRETVYELSRTWAATLTSRLELVPVLDLRPHQLSPGQRLRAALARAAVCLPEVLVVDLPECGGMTGVETVAELRDLLARASLTTAPAMAVLLCTADARVGTGADRTAAVAA